MNAEEQLKALQQVPVSSLFRGKEGWHLFVIEDGRAVDKAVTIGMKGTLQAQVLAGVRIGERVVVHPTNELKDGMSAKITVYTKE